MTPQIINVVETCTRVSDEGRTTFGHVVGKLMEAGVERYHADLLRAEKIYYMPDGTSHRTPCAFVATTPANAFNADGIVDAIRAIQGQNITYAEFCERIAAAGCVGYLVSLAGRRAVYYGRTGDSYVEPFPSAA